MGGQIKLPDTATIKQLLEAGAHFGHQTGRWHPRMKNYIFTKRQGIHIIDLEKTAGMLANFATIQARVDQLVRLEDQQARGEFGRLTKKEILKIGEKIEHMNRQMGGFKEMTALPGTLFIIDPTKERIALAEARRMG